MPTKAKPFQNLKLATKTSLIIGAGALFEPGNFDAAVKDYSIYRE